MDVMTNLAFELAMDDLDGYDGTVRCRYCKSTDVHWEKQGSKWVLFNTSNKTFHSCKEYRKD